jgi:predicted ATPase/class 3 adenylate cyclase
VSVSHNRRRDLPSGTVTFLFTDIEGSTRLLAELGDSYAQALAEHRRALRTAFERHGGVEVDTQGDAFFVAFAEAASALKAAEEARQALALPVRIGLHTGEPQLTEEGYVGLDVHRAARICAVAHGGQVVLSERTRALVDEAGLTDLGLHRLKDLTEPVRLFQLGEEAFPSLRSLNATNLPVQPNPLVGRATEVEYVTGLLRDGTRLVTLTGPGGTGKTRLALQAAAELIDDFPDGVFWVPLASLRDPELVVPTIEQTLGAKVPLAEHVDEKRMLLVLDNVEQVIGCATDLSTLLSRCPNLALLVTSRALLRIEGEREYQVPSLPDDDAIALFRERAVSVEPTEAVGDICRRLDGLPLAIELAAARTRVLPPEQLLERLEQRLPLLTSGTRDSPERQRTLRATIEWSYGLLKPDERELFARVAVFAGGFTLAAAEEVCEAGLDTLESLVEQSLVRRQEDRLTTLETIREFAAERLDDRSESAEVRYLHAHYFLRLTEAAEPQILGRGQRAWLGRLESEIDNLRVAIGWLLDRGDCGQALACHPRADQARAKGLLAASLLADRQGDTERARNQGHESAEIAKRLGEHRVASRAFSQLAGAAIHEGAFEECAQLAEEARALARSAGDDHLHAFAINALAIATFEKGDHDRARELLEQVAQSLREVGDQRNLSLAVSNLAMAELLDGNHERGLAALRSEIEIREGLGDQGGLVRAHVNFGVAAVLYGDLREAEAHLITAARDAREMGDTPTLVAAINGFAGVLARRSHLVEAALLRGVVDRAVEESQLPLVGTDGLVEDVLLKQAATDLGDEAWLEAKANGRKLTLEEAVDYYNGELQPID